MFISVSPSDTTTHPPLDGRWIIINHVSLGMQKARFDQDYGRGGAWITDRKHVLRRMEIVQWKPLRFQITLASGSKRDRIELQRPDQKTRCFLRNAVGTSDVTNPFYLASKRAGTFLHCYSYDFVVVEFKLPEYETFMDLINCENRFRRFQVVVDELARNPCSPESLRAH